jgi:gliding motility-associated-like protein
MNCYNTIIKIFAFIFLIFNSTLKVSAQQPTSGDCLGAYTVCALNYNQPASFVGQGNYLNEINALSSCLSSGERNNSWYMVTIQSPGELNFSISPNCDSADYDWSVFNLTNASCSDIATNAALEVACNFSGSTFPTAVTGPNGAVSGTGTLLPQSGPPINVLAGQVYAIVVNNFTGANQCGYILDFSASSAGIIDQTAPVFSSPIAQQVSCNANSVTFNFSEFVKCETVLSQNFMLIGPSPNFDTIPIVGVTGAACLNGGSLDKQFTLLLGSTLNDGGLYTIRSFGRVEDNCGNFTTDTLELTFNIQSFSVQMSSTDVNCIANNGTATVTLNVATPSIVPPYQVVWQPSGQTGSFTPPTPGHTATSLPFGMQYVTISDQSGCTVRDSVFVSDPNNFNVDLVITTDVCSFGVGGAEAIVTGGTPFVSPPKNYPYTFLWEVTGQTNNTPTISDLTTGIYFVNVTDSLGCVFRKEFFVPDFRYNLEPDFIFSPDTTPIPGVFPTVTFINQSLNATSFHWDFGQDFSNEYEPTYIFPGSGVWDVKLTVTNEFGCKDSITKQIEIDFLLTYFSPNAFSPNNDNVNDTFNVVVTGILEDTYLMKIFDRWGEEVFTTNNLKEGWLGKKMNNGKICPSGVYVFRNSFIDQSGKKHVKYGRILLLG